MNDKSIVHRLVEVEQPQLADILVDRFMVRCYHLHHSVTAARFYKREKE